MKSNNLAPIVLFVYDRLKHTKQTIDALLKNNLASQSDLFIYSDGAKSREAIEIVNEVRMYIKTITGFNSIQIIQRKENYGLAKSIISGVSEIMTQYGKVIVMEDDLIVSENFLDYMNESLTFYQNDRRVCSISGFSYDFGVPGKKNIDVYLFPRFCSWGWATWCDRWLDVCWDENELKKISMYRRYFKFSAGGVDLPVMLRKQINNTSFNSWAIRFSFFQANNGCYTVYPIQSKVMNIGYDQGVHANGDEHRVALDDGSKRKFRFSEKVSGLCFFGFHLYLFRYYAFKKIFKSF